MDWTDYFDITDISCIPYSPEYPEWKYYSFQVIATKPFELFGTLQNVIDDYSEYTKRVSVFIPATITQLDMYNCNILVQHKPIIPPTIINIKYWFNTNMPDKETVINYMRSLIKGEASVMLLTQEYADLLDHHVLSHRTYHALHAYLGTELFGEFYYG